MSVQADASGMCQGRCGAADSGAPEITGASRAPVQVSHHRTAGLYFRPLLPLFSFWREDSLSKQTQGVWLAASIWKGRGLGGFLFFFFAVVVITVCFVFNSSFSLCFLLDFRRNRSLPVYGNWPTYHWLCSLEVETGTHIGLKFQSVFIGNAVLLNVGSVTLSISFPMNYQGILIITT